MSSMPQRHLPLTLDKPEDIEGFARPSLLQLAAQAALQAGAAVATPEHGCGASRWTLRALALSWSTADVVTYASSCIAPISPEPQWSRRTTRHSCALISAYGEDQAAPPRAMAVLPHSASPVRWLLMWQPSKAFLEELREACSRQPA